MLDTIVADETRLLDAIVAAVMKHQPIGVTADEARQEASRMKPGDTLYLERSYMGKSGRLLVVSDRAECQEFDRLCETSGRWFCITRKP